MLHLHAARQLQSIYMYQWVISPANDNDADLKTETPIFGIDLNE